MKVRTKEGGHLPAHIVHTRRKTDGKSVRALCVGDNFIIEPGSPMSSLTLLQATPDEQKQLAICGFRLQKGNNFSTLPYPDETISPHPPKAAKDEAKYNSARFAHSGIQCVG